MARTLNADLTGDGRHTYHPNPLYETIGLGWPLRLGTIRMVVNAFKLAQTQTSYHSPSAATIWAIQEYLILNDTPHFAGQSQHGGIVTLDKDAFEAWKEFTASLD